MKLNDNKGKIFAAVLSLFVIMTICAVALIYHSEKIQFKKISMLKQKQHNDGPDYITCQLFSNIGTQNHLMLKMAIPYENKSQYEDLSGKINRIKSDMLTNIDQREMNKWIKERDYVAMKGALLKVINKHAKTPVNHIYFDSFLYQ